MKIKSLVIALIIFPAIIMAQSGALKLGILIDTPAANIPDRGQIQSSLRMYSNGGLLGSILIGLSPRFALGVSYGGENIVGTGDINLNPQPAVEVRYLLFEERFLFPSIEIGFNSQGYGAYNSELKRYSVKSLGFYAVASKNTSFLGGLGIHGGINISTETNDGDKDPNVFFGCHKQLNKELVLLAEYNTAINDNSDNAVGSGKGYLNFGIRWVFAQQLFIEFDMRNVLENGDKIAGSSREVKLFYVTHF
ncbi:hypothetical protein J7K93_04535 [bacterium]|nr:hypothetical protein [bacterium]